NIKIAILPFSLEARQSNDKLLKEIPLLISKKLELEGTKVVLAQLKENPDKWNFQQFRKYGIEKGVDYILTGSVFLAGQSISIDSKLINVYEKENFTSIYADASTLENLFSAITKLSKEITGELYQQQIIINIAVEGNKRIEADAILRNIDSKTGDIIKSENISKDLRKIYGMGYFDDIVAEKQTIDTGVKVVFKVIEKSTIRKVGFKDNSVYEDKDLNDIVSTRTGGILNINTLNTDVDRMRMMYTEKNYHNCSVIYEIKPLEHSQADIIFSFKEGEKLKVEKISLEGNKYFSDKEIKKAMETAEKGFFSMFTSSGDLNEIEVQNDVVRIESLYKNNGFIDAKVSDPDIKIGEKFISIHFNIEEGS
ncbi:MAG: outer membrane protein assembly factor BamA, partial [archaeon]|nr:outer membrane protein assembly factor BamA [archaeon]